MRFFILTTAIAVNFVSPVVGESARPNISEVALRYVEAQEAAMESSAGPAQAAALVAFYTEDYVYHHPQFGARISGRDTIMRGITSHFGETADADIEVKGILVNGDMVSIAMEERFTALQDMKEVRRPRMMILTFKKGKIAQRIDA